MEIQKKLICILSLVLCLFLLTDQKVIADGGYVLIQTGNNWATPDASGWWGENTADSYYWCGYDSLADVNCIYLRAITRTTNEVYSGKYEGAKGHGVVNQAGAGVVNNWEWDGFPPPTGGTCSYFIGELLPFPYPGCGYNQGTYWDYATWGHGSGLAMIEVSHYCDIPFAYSSSNRNITMTHFVYNDDEEEYEEYGVLGSTMSGYCRRLHSYYDLEGACSNNVYGDDVDVIVDTSGYSDIYDSPYDTAYYGHGYDGLKFMAEVTSSVNIPEWTSIFEAGFSFDLYHQDLGITNSYYEEVEARAFNTGLIRGIMNIAWDFAEY